MKKRWKKAASLLLALVMATSLLAVPASANASASACSVKVVHVTGEGYDLTAVETMVDENIFEMVVTDNLTGQKDILRVEKYDDNNSASYGWYDVAGKNIDSAQTWTCDFSYAIVNGILVYKEKNSAPAILGSIDAIRSSIFSETIDSLSSVLSVNDTYPTPWYTAVFTGDVGNIV